MNKLSNIHRVVSNVQSQPVSLVTSARDNKMTAQSDTKALKVSVNEYQDLQPTTSSKEKDREQSHQQIIQQSYYAAVQTERFPNNGNYFSQASERKEDAIIPEHIEPVRLVKLLISKFISLSSYFTLR